MELVFLGMQQKFLTSGVCSVIKCVRVRLFDRFIELNLFLKSVTLTINVVKRI